ncbi:hypothetical protein DF3PA_70143 [Candidatus Defluviicoccus seviourii]|uniref:Uncharacterized protein n=1 Tax=Candidatus Defluviicoccus seviourii TaxID=2565273 RepID=A0A564WHA3_9PROT|nr:hypothetical protein DF3PA_70143 [Candidatus Defluviicoccus seviourii]
MRRVMTYYITYLFGPATTNRTILARELNVPRKQICGVKRFVNPSSWQVFDPTFVFGPSSKEFSTVYELLCAQTNRRSHHFLATFSKTKDIASLMKMRFLDGLLFRWVKYREVSQEEYDQMFVRGVIYQVQQTHNLSLLADNYARRKKLDRVSPGLFLRVQSALHNLESEVGNLKSIWMTDYLKGDF